MYSLMTIMHLPLVSWVCQYDQEYNQQKRDNYLKGNFSKLLHQGSVARHKSASNLNPMLEVSDDSRQ